MILSMHGSSLDVESSRLGSLTYRRAVLLPFKFFYDGKEGVIHTLKAGRIVPRADWNLC
jgi:hypothetical protein